MVDLKIKYMESSEYALSDVDVAQLRIIDDHDDLKGHTLPVATKAHIDAYIFLTKRKVIGVLEIIIGDESYLVENGEFVETVPELYMGGVH